MAAPFWIARVKAVDYFGDLELVEPGLVPLAEWRPSRGAIRTRKR